MSSDEEKVTTEELRNKEPKEELTVDEMAEKICPEVKTGDVRRKKSRYQALYKAADVILNSGLDLTPGVEKVTGLVRDRAQALITDLPAAEANPDRIITHLADQNKRLKKQLKSLEAQLKKEQGNGGLMA